MTLYQIANELQLLIDRLTTARNLLSSLRPESELVLTAPTERPPLSTGRRRTNSPASEATVTPQIEMGAAAGLPETVANQPKVTVLPPRRHRSRLAPRKNRRRQAPLSALMSSVPSGPVFVTAAEIRRRATTPELPHHVEMASESTPDADLHPAQTASGHSLDDLLREFASRQPSSSISF